MFKTGLGYDASSSTAAFHAVESFVNSSEMLKNQEYNKSKSDKGYHAVPLPHTGNFIPFKPDLTFMDEIVESENIDVTTVVTPSNVKKVKSNNESINKGDVVEPKTVRRNNVSIQSLRIGTLMMIVRGNVVKPQHVVKSVKFAKETVENVETPKQNKHYPRGNQRNWNNLISQRLGSDFKMINKACFVCGSFEHLHYVCDKKVIRPVWNNSSRVNHKNFANKVTNPHPNRRFVPQELLSRSGKINIAGARVNIAVRPVNTAGSKSTMNHPRSISNAYKKGYSQVIRPFNKYSANKNSIFNKKVNTVRVKDTTARVRAVVSKNKRKGANAVKASACWGNPQQKEYKEKGVIDNSCSRNMTRNKCYLIEHEDYDGGFVSFGDGKGRISGKVLSSDFKLLDESQVLLRVPRKDNIYSVVLKSVVPTKEIENQLDHKVKVIRCDNETEFKNSVMNQFSKMKGIKREFSVAKTPQQNGVAERKNRTLIEAIRTILVYSKMPTAFWAKAVNTACYVLNRVLVIKPHNKTPYELIRRRTPLIDFMKPFGFPVTILNTRDHLSKFERKGDEGFFGRYSMVSKVMRVFNKRTRIVEETLNIRFLDNTPNVIGNGPDWLFDVDSLTISMNYVPVITGNQNNGIAGKRDYIVAGQAEKKKEPKQEYILIPFCITDLLIYQGPKDSEEDFGVKPTEVDKCEALDKDRKDEQDTRKPKKVIQALADPSWVEAMQEELLQFKLQKMDVKSDFLYSTIKEEVYVCQPPGYEDLHFPDKVYKVEKALYGLHQVLRAWNETLSTYLIENRFRRGLIDKTLFIKKDKGDILLVQVYVDVIIFGSTKKSLCDEFEEKYVADILKKFDFVTVKTSSTLIETNKALIMGDEAENVDVHLYRSMIGSLMYLIASRPDIMFAVYACARFQVTPKMSHLHAMKRIFRYLKGQPKLGLWYPKDSPFDLEAFSNSDYARASLNRKSTTEGCQFLGKRMISCQCKKQTIVTNSTTEEEYVAAANCCGQVLWIQNQMLDYGFNFINTKIYIDNESIICIVKNPVFHSKTKHIEIRHHFIRDSYEKKLIQVIKIHTDHNVADLLIKAFDVRRFNFLIASIGLINL
ncbi:putative ribonuclease H-like domain-containing protein [Tanacetum coccineum]